MARIFLYVFAGIIALVLVALTLLNICQDQLTDWALAQTVPSRAFAEVAPPPAPDYATPAAWAARPDDPGTAALVPEGVVDIAMMPRADVFFIHPTTYGISPGEHGGRDALYWNAPIDDPVAGDRIDHGILKYQASAFNLAGRIHAPHYRQATFGVFFDTSDARRRALSLAYQDVERAFDRYIAHDNAGRPFILAGHSQGALHALLLLKERIAGTPLAERPPVDPLELVRRVAAARNAMPEAVVRLSAGRSALSREAQILCMVAGANSIFYGDTLLTTPNAPPGEDAALLEALAPAH